MVQAGSGATPSRRALLFAGSATLAGVLTGCTIRVGQPTAARTPTATPTPETSAVLRETIARLDHLAAAAGRVPAVASDGAKAAQAPTRNPSGSPATKKSASAGGARVEFARTLATLHRRQAGTLRGALGTSTSSTAASTPTTTAAPSPPTGRATGLHRLGVLEARAAAPAVLAELTHVAADRLPAMACIAAFGAAAALQLDVSPTWPAAGSAHPHTVGVLLAQVQPCVYALEQVAARTAPTERSKVTASLRAMYAARSRLAALAGPSAYPPAPGYDLPVRPDDDASRRRLARIMLGRVMTGAAGCTARPIASVDDLTLVVRLWAVSLHESWRWGITPVAFPGLPS